MKNLKTGYYPEFRDILDGLHFRPLPQNQLGQAWQTQYDKFGFCKGLYNIVNF